MGSPAAVLLLAAFAVTLGTGHATQAKVGGFIDRLGTQISGNIPAHATDKDQLEVAGSTDLTALKNVTILDTGLYITNTACDNPKLAAAFSALEEIRGVLTIDNTCAATTFLDNLAVVRGDLALNSVAVVLTGFELSNLKALKYVGGNITEDGVAKALPASACASCGDKGCNPNKSCCAASCLGGCAAGGQCNACADGFLRAPDGTCGTTCPAGHKEYGFKVHIVDTWTVSSILSERFACDVDGKGRQVPGTGGGGWGRVDARRYCVDKCPKGTFVTHDGKECVAHCPGLVFAHANGTCPSGFSGTVCDAHFDHQDSWGLADVYGASEVNSRCHVEVLAPLDCTILNASFYVSKINDLTGTGVNDLKELKKIKRLAGAVYAYQTPFPSLDFLENVESIYECSDTDPYLPRCKFEPESKHTKEKPWGLWPMDGVTGQRILAVAENPYMQSLNLLNLRVVGGSDWEASAGVKTSIDLLDNLQMCLHDTIDWPAITNQTGSTALGFSAEFLKSTRILSNMEGYSVEQRKLFDTADVHPFLCPARTCDAVCGIRGCWSTEEDECQMCEGDKVLRGGVCLPGSDCEEGAPSPGFFADPAVAICKACHSTCDDCKGPRYNDCTKCIGSQVLLPNGVCANACERGWYNNSGICSKCKPECVECTTLEQCDTCDVTLGDGYYLNQAARTCVLEASCPVDTHAADNTAICTKCDASCITCNNYGANSCTKCAPNKILSFENDKVNHGYCYSECPRGLYNNNGTCSDCFPFCAACYGKGQDQCTACKNGYSKDGDTCYDVGECPKGKFPKQADDGQKTLACEDCGASCAKCADMTPPGASSTTTFCQTCMGSQYLDSLNDFRCVPECPLEYFGVGLDVEKRFCQECRVCKETEYVASPATACRHGGNRQCESCTTCDTNFQFFNRTCKTGSVGIEHGHDAQCVDLAICGANQWQTQAPTTLSNRVCKDLTLFDSATQYEASPATPTSDRVVKQLTVCNTEIQYITMNNSATSDRTCASLTKCTLGEQYLLQPPTEYSNRVCQECATCAINEREQANGCNGIVDRKCDFIDRCSAQPCENGGTCINNQGFNYTCNCLADFTGKDCDIRRSVCEKDVTCLNGGLCTSIGTRDTDFECDCPVDISGLNCELNVTVCEPNPCSNNATCVPEPDNQFSCDCVGNTTGTYCQKDLSICLPGGIGYGDACNGGDCTPGDNGGFQCENCPEGKCGNTCEREKDASGVCSANYVDSGAAASDQSAALEISAGIAGTIVFIAILLVVLVIRYAKKEINKNQAYEDFKDGKDIEADEWEIDRLLLTIGPEIGSGNFGNVNKGMYMNPDLDIDKSATLISGEECAIKSLKLSNLDYGVVGPDGVQLEDPRHHQAAKDFFDEMKLMKDIGKHRNVVSLTGVCTQDRPYLIVLDFSDLGDLRHYLIERRPTSSKASQIDYQDMLSFSIQIANGMEFLTMKHKIVHRDLAARNVLVKTVKHTHVAKVSDFGLARDVYEEDFYQKSDQGQMAIKWMSPEALVDRMFTSKGDVWSFGVVMWEIASLGGAPYPGHTNYEMTKALVEEKYRMPPPHGCKTPFHQQMMECWKEDPKERPTFKAVKDSLVELSGFSLEKLKTILGEDTKKTLGRRKTKKPGFKSLHKNASQRASQRAYAEPMDPSYEAPGPGGEGGGNYLTPTPRQSSSELGDDNGAMNPRFQSVRTKESIENFQATTISGENMYDAGNDGVGLTASPSQRDTQWGSLAPMDGGGAYDMATELAPTDVGEAYDMATEAPPDGAANRLTNNAAYDMASTERGEAMLEATDAGALYDTATDQFAPQLAPTDGGALYDEAADGMGGETSYDGEISYDAPLAPTESGASGDLYDQAVEEDDDVGGFGVAKAEPYLDVATSAVTVTETVFDM